MPEDFDRIIFKLELDDQGYIRGLESMSDSTKKLVAVQTEANNKLRESEAALKANAAVVEKNKTIVDEIAKSATRKFGDDTRAITILKKSQEEQERLTKIVDDNRKAYEAATKAAQDFAATSQRATNLQPPGGGSVNPPIVPPVVPPIIPPDIFTDLTGLSGLDEIVANTKEEFNDLQAAVLLCEEVIKSFDPGTEEFKALTDVITKGKQALLDYENANKKIEGTTKSYASEIKAATLELKRLQESETATTKQIIEQEQKVAQLTDAYEKQRARIKVLGSDTRALDFGKAAVQGAISAFQAYTSVSVLAGGASEEMQKKVVQLFAAMQLLTSLEQLSTSVKKGSVLATNLQSASTAAYNAILKASETALGRFKIALAATGIGLAVVAVGFLVKKFQELGESSSEAARKQKLLNDVVKETSGDYVKAYTEVSKLKDQFELANKGIGSQRDALIEYNKTLGDTVGFATSFNEAEQLLTKNASAYIRITQLKAEANLLLAKSAEANLKLDQALILKVDPNLPAFQRKALQKLKDDLVKDAEQSVKDISDLFVTITNKVQSETKAATGKTTQQLLADSLPKPGTVAAAKKVLEGQIADLKSAYDKLSQTNTAGRKRNQDEQDKLQAQLDNLSGKKPKKGKSVVENTFEVERAELEAALKELRNKEAVTIEKINEEFAAKLEADRLKIQKEIKDKKILGDLTKPLEQQPQTQAGILFSIQVKINDEQKKQAIDKLNKEITDARQKLNDDLKALQEKNILDSINLIQDDFDRRAALIEFNEGREIEAAKVANQKRLEALDLQKGLIPLQEFEDAQAAIVEAGEQNLLNITRRFAEERNALAEDKFNEFLTFIDGAVDNINLEIDEALAKEIQGQSDKFVAGKISFEQYQKAISEIQRRQENIRRDRTLFLHKVEIEDLEVQLNNIDDKTSKKYIRLQEKLKRLREKYAKEQQANAQGDAADTQADDEIEAARLAKIRDVATAIGEVTNSIISFWQQANAAEAEALDRSIALQEKRVDAAQRIAERGNAQYLKAETDRLKELQVARENAARRELAINAALQASQLLVGITGAITKIATPGVGTAEVIASIAVIFAALATGYGLVKSLQGNQPQFKEGTKSVKRAGQPAGVDTIQAWVSEGEAIIPARTNKEYHPAVTAIYDKKIPAEVLNNYVNNYVNRKDIFERIHTVKPIAQPNYERIGEAATIHIQHDSKLAGLLMEQNRKIDENNDLQRATMRALQKMGVSVNMDRNGIAVSVMEVIDQQRKDSRT